jgi:hypothetical protein
VNSALPSSLLLLLFFLPFTWGRHRRARATTALPRATSLELLILFDQTKILITEQLFFDEHDVLCRRIPQPNSAQLQEPLSDVQR